MGRLAYRLGSLIGAVLLVSLLASACASSNDSTNAQSDSQPEPAPEVAAPNAGNGATVTIDNQGGSMEGHTPRGFAGMGTGLFTGDNLNSGFPDGDGVQLFLTFDLPSGAATPTEVILATDVLSTSGNPFVDLGVLMVEPVSYGSFGRDLFDLSAIGPAVECERPDEVSLRCDVSAAAAEAFAAEAERLQFRLKFEQVADNDGEQDLALFFLTDSNTNEPGIFFLQLS